VRESIRYRLREDDRALELVAGLEHLELGDGLGGQEADPQPGHRGEQPEVRTPAMRGARFFLVRVHGPALSARETDSVRRLGGPGRAATTSG